MRRPIAMVWMPDEAIVVVEAGLPEQPNSGRLTWASAESARQTMLDDLPSDANGGPTGLAMGPSGLLVLVGACGQPRCATLLAPDAAGVLTVMADLAGRAPWGLAVRSDGAAYVTDARRGELLRIDRAGLEPAIVARFGADASPRGLAVAPDGTTYVALHGLGTVARVAPDGAISRLADGLAQPIAVGLDPDGRVLVLEHQAGRLTRLGNLREHVSREMEGPTGLVLAPDGRAYVSVGGLAGDRPGRVLQIRRLGPVGARRLV